jgi:hypothetical protein
MIVLLQLLSVLVPGALALMYFGFVVGPIFAAVVGGKSFTIKVHHPFLLALTASIALALAVAYGWVVLP